MLTGCFSARHFSFVIVVLGGFVGGGGGSGILLTGKRLFCSHTFFCSLERVYFPTDRSLVLKEEE